MLQKNVELFSSKSDGNSLYLDCSGQKMHWRKENYISLGEWGVEKNT